MTKNGCNQTSKVLISTMMNTIEFHMEIKAWNAEILDAFIFNIYITNFYLSSHLFNNIKVMEKISWNEEKYCSGSFTIQHMWSLTSRCLAIQDNKLQNGENKVSNESQN